MSNGTDCETHRAWARDLRRCLFCEIETLQSKLGTEQQRAEAFRGQRDAARDRADAAETRLGAVREVVDGVLRGDNYDHAEDVCRTIKARMEHEPKTRPLKDALKAAEGVTSYPDHPVRFAPDVEGRATPNSGDTSSELVVEKQRTQDCGHPKGSNQCPFCDEVLGARDR